MKRTDFVIEFSSRLNRVLQKEGHTSSYSKAGIKINQLAKAAGVSYQMARKYILGMALPDYHIIPTIAKWLNVSPGWLLFGDNESTAPEPVSPSLIKIDIELLKYILYKCTMLFPETTEPEKIAHYMASVIYDASHINADTKTILKIIDMMLSSAIQLAEINLHKRAQNA